MKTAYTDLNIHISIDDATFLILNIVCECFTRPMPKHSHGNNSYEVHFIPCGCGTLYISGSKYEAKPGTLYVTGPHIEHEQIPDPADPMTEYCVYFKLEKGSISKSIPGSVSTIFTNTPFWFGQDTQDLYPILQQLFFELEHKYSGYMIQVESLLQQCVVKMIRNYESKKESNLHFAPSNLVDSKYLIVEESFLYDYQTITLEGLANRLGLGIRQTERFIKDYYGKTFSQKKTEARMNMAKIFLNDRELTISEIAKRLNYSSVEHFAYAFKKYYGLSAGAYRKQST